LIVCVSLAAKLGVVYSSIYLVVQKGVVLPVTPGFAKNKTRHVICVPRKSTHTTTE
jgi:hypothetical protein